MYISNKKDKLISLFVLCTLYFSNKSYLCNVLPSGINQSPLPEQNYTPAFGSREFQIMRKRNHGKPGSAFLKLQNSVVWPVKKTGKIREGDTCVPYGHVKKKEENADS